MRRTPEIFYNTINSLLTYQSATNNHNVNSQSSPRRQTAGLWTLKKAWFKARVFLCSNDVFITSV